MAQVEGMDMDGNIDSHIGLDSVFLFVIVRDAIIKNLFLRFYVEVVSWYFKVDNHDFVIVILVYEDFKIVVQNVSLEILKLVEVVQIIKHYFITEMGEIIESKIFVDKIIMIEAVEMINKEKDDPMKGDNCS